MRVDRIIASRNRWLPWVAFAVIAAHAIDLLVLKVGNGLTFYYDEWAFLLRRRGMSWGTFFRPHGVHLSAVPVAIYKTMLQLFGLNYRPFQWLLMVFLVGLAALVYVYAIPRVGRWLGLLPVIVILWSGSFWEDTLWPFQIGFIGSLVCGIGAFMALERRTTRADLVASLLLLLSVSQSSIGLPFIAGVGFELVLRRDWRRLWVVAMPLVLYGAWKVAYPGTDVRRENIGKTPRYVYAAAAGAFGSIFSLDLSAGKIMLFGALGLLADALLRGRSSVRLWSLAATVLAFWVAAALARAQLGAPDVSRYLLPGATLIMLIAVEAARDWRPKRTGVFVLIALVPIMYSHGKEVLSIGSGTIVTYSQYLKADYLALKLIRPYLKLDPATWQLDAQRAPDIDVKSYYSLIDDFGDPAPSFDEVMRLPGPARQNADGVMIVGSGTSQQQIKRPHLSGRTPQIATRYWAEGAPTGEDGQTAGGGCVLGHAAGGGPNPYLEFVVPPEGLSYRPIGPIVNVSLRLFGDDVQLRFGAPAPGAWASVKPPPLRGPRPWIARFELATSPLRVCSGA